MDFCFLIFDFDGVLADTAGWFLQNYDEVAERFGLLRLTPEELDALRGLSNREVVARLRTSAWKLPFIAAHVRKLMQRDAGDLQLFDGAAEMLAEFEAAGMTLAVVSSNSEANIRRILGGAGDHVAHYVCGAALFGKARKFQSLVKRSGVAPAQVLCIGDETRDIEAAREAGLACAAVTWGYARAEALAAAGPDFTFTSVAELRSALCPARALQG